MLLLIVLWGSALIIQVDSLSKEANDARTEDQMKEWVNAEKQFHQLEAELEGVLGDVWGQFRQFMTSQIVRLHENDACKSLEYPSPMLINDCRGKAGLTESEFILHKALDAFSDKIGDKHVVHRYHNMAHVVFEHTRRLLENMALMQAGEYAHQALNKQNQMRLKYKRSTPPAE